LHSPYCSLLLLLLLDFFLHLPPRDDSSHSAQGGLGQLRQEELWALSTKVVDGGRGGRSAPVAPLRRQPSPSLLHLLQTCSSSPCSCTGRPRCNSCHFPTCSRTSTARAENPTKRATRRPPHTKTHTGAGQDRFTTDNGKGAQRPHVPILPV
jgi:hypothetical protein